MKTSDRFRLLLDCLAHSPEAPSPNSELPSPSESGLDRTDRSPELSEQCEDIPRG
jgi:hypothetical protein